MPSFMSSALLIIASIMLRPIRFDFQAITYCHRCFLLSFIIRWKAGRLSVFPETAASE